MRGYARAVVVGVGALALGRVAVYLFRLRPAIEGVDFYNYLCVARDMHHGATDLSDWRYAYFPGVYAFWRMALTIGGESLAGVQWIYAALLGANAAALGVTVWRTARSWLGLVVACVGYVVIVARFEGGYGVAEPIATFPIALSLAIWAGEPLRGRRGLVLAAVLGVGIGLAAYVKQQGALQAAGWLALPAANLLSKRRNDWRAIAIVPAAAAVVFVIGILAEGHGFFPLRMGIKAAMTYAASTPFAFNVGEIAHQMRPLALAILLAIPAAAIALWRVPRLRDEPWVPVALFTLFAGTSALYQFTKRDYFHYALLCAPWLLLAVVHIAVALWRAIPKRDLPVVGFAVLLLCALPFVHTDDPASDALFLWPPQRIEQPNLGHWRFQPLVVDDFRKLSEILRRGEDVMVMPPRHDDIHFLIGTRSVSWAQGYNWGFAPSPAAETLTSPTLSAIVILGWRDPTDDWTWNWHKCDEAVKNLRRSGFRPVAQLRTMQVWRRK